MAQATIYKRVYLGGAGHHRQPPGSRRWDEISPPELIAGMGAFHSSQPAEQELVYAPAGGARVVVEFMFWSQSDGSRGRTQVEPLLDYSVGPHDDLTLVAWYRLPGGGPGSPGSNAVIVDEFSVEASTFIYDDFVTVTSDPSLTERANVEGVIPTTSDETAAAFAEIPNGEAFEHWIVGPGGCSASGDTLTAPMQSDGYAFASYHRLPIHLKPAEPAVGPNVVIIGGKADEPGGRVTWWWGEIPDFGHPVPQPAWTLATQLMAAESINAAAAGLSTEAGDGIRKSAAQEVARLRKEFGQAIGKEL